MTEPPRPLEPAELSAAIRTAVDAACDVVELVLREMFRRWRA